MYRIAICDDDKKYADYLEKKILEYINKDFVCIEKYTSGFELKENISRYYDLIILDYFLDGIEGVEVANELRKYHRETILVFCTGEKEPEASFFKLNPYRYLLKQIKDDEMGKEIKEILDYLIAKNKWCIVLKNSDGIKKIKAKDILYVQKQKNGSEIVYYELDEDRYNRIKSREHIKEIFSEIEGSCDFEYANTSYFINYSKVKNIINDEVVLQNDEILSISRSKKKLFITGYVKFCKRKRGN